jgi:hypothetical protein
MKSDMKALLKVFGWSFAVAVLAIGVGMAAAIGWITKEAAVSLMLGCIVVGGVVIGRRFSRGLLHQQSPKDKPAGPSAASERDATPPSSETSGRRGL